MLGACGPSFSAGSSSENGGAGAAGGSGGSTAHGGTGASAGAGGRAQGGSGGHAGSAAGGSAGAVGGNGGTASGAGGSGGSGGANAGAGGNTVSPIPTNGLSLWLRADAGVMQANGGVQTWLDQSGQHMDATASAANTAPKLIMNGSLNGMPTLEFDGTDDFMSLPSGFADFTEGLSVFIVGKASDGNCASMWEAANGTEVQDISLGLYQFTWQYEVEDQDVNGGVIDPPNAALAVIGAVQRPGGAVELRVNSNLVQQGTYDAPEVVLRKVNYVGYTSYANCGHFAGQISEIIVYDRGLTIAEVNALEGYLEKRYAIVVAVP